MTKQLPQWAQDLKPLSEQRAAIVLGLGLRRLRALAPKHQHYEKRANRRVYYREHITELRAWLDQLADTALEYP